MADVLKAVHAMADKRTEAQLRRQVAELERIYGSNEGGWSQTAARLLREKRIEPARETPIRLKRAREQ